ncbi:MAG: response regulator transcription factor [Clostridia bacterium]|nr:response regulator transcription factor [Clostridia bacterium]
MIRIIICDDDVPFAEYLERQVKEIFTDLKNETDIRSFTSPEECLKYVTRDGADTDVVFLDIDMPGTTGFDIAKEIKKERRGPLVVFVSCKQELVFDSFDYHPFSFVRKNAGDEFRTELTNVCRGILNVLRQKELIEVINVEAGKQLVSAEDILYVESDDHYLVYHLIGDKGQMKERGSMREALAKLKHIGFIRPHASYIVNSSHISLFSTKLNKIILDTKDIIFVSRGMKEHALEEYLKFKRTY